MCWWLVKKIFAVRSNWSHCYRGVLIFLASVLTLRNLVLFLQISWLFWAIRCLPMGRWLCPRIGCKRLGQWEKNSWCYTIRTKDLFLLGCCVLFSEWRCRLLMRVKLHDCIRSICMIAWQFIWESIPKIRIFRINLVYINVELNWTSRRWGTCFFGVDWS